MINNIAYFPKFCALNSGPVMKAVLESLQAAGIQTQENSMTADAAVIWSVLWHGRMWNNQAIYEHYRGQNKPVVVIDVGALIRGTTWKVAVNNINALGYYGHHTNLDWDRPKKLGLLNYKTKPTLPHVLIAAQHARSQQVLGLDLNQWIVKMINEIQASSNRPIVVRQHPRHYIGTADFGTKVTIEKPNKIAETYDSYDINYNCHAVVNCNSGPGIQAALAGTRVIVDSSSLAYPVSIKVEELEMPVVVRRESWTVEISHTEYTLEELAQGTWLKRIAPALIAPA